MWSVQQTHTRRGPDKRKSAARRRRKSSGWRVSVATPETEGHEMPKYMDVHDGFIGITREQLQQAHRQDLNIQAEEGVTFERAWLDPEAGKAFCLSSAPSKEAIMRIHQRAGHPTNEVYQLEVEVS